MAKPKKLEQALRRQYSDVNLGPNTLKNWLADWRREKQGIYTPTQATLDLLEKKGYWYRFATDVNDNVTGIFWCTNEQINWIREILWS